MSNWLQNNSEEKAIDVQPSNPGTKPRENERHRESSLEQKDERKVIDRKKLDRENKKQNGNILAWIKSQENQKIRKENRKDKAIAMMRRKSPPSEKQYFIENHCQTNICKWRRGKGFITFFS